MILHVSGTFLPVQGQFHRVYCEKCLSEDTIFEILTFVRVALSCGFLPAWVGYLAENINVESM